MKKNFFATLIIAAFIVVMSFSLTSCDLFNRGDGSGSNGGSSSRLDESKLTAAAKADKDAQALALMIEDEQFDAWRNGDWDHWGTVIVTREYLANLFAEVFSSAFSNDPYRVYYNEKYEEDGDFGKGGYFANSYMYDVLKESEVTLEEFFKDEDKRNTIWDKLCVYDEESQKDCYRGFCSMMECVYASSPEFSFGNDSTVGVFIEEMKEYLFNDDECVYSVYGDENKCVGIFENTFIFYIGDNVYGSGKINGLID